MTVRAQSLAARLGRFLVGGAFVVLAAVFLINYMSFRALILRDIGAQVRHLSHAARNEITTILAGVEKGPRYAVALLEARPPAAEEDVLALCRSLVATDDEIFGSTIAFEPHRFDTNRLYYAPYYFRGPDGIKLSWLGSESYRVFELDWYTVPRALGRPVWSEPYYDEGGGDIIMSTFSVPFYRQGDGGRVFEGVVTADLSLDRLRQTVGTLSVLESGYAFLVSAKGVFVTHPDPQRILRESLFDLAAKRRDPELQRVGEDMIRGGEGFVALAGFDDDRPCRLYYAPIPALGWSLGVVLPERELLAELWRLNRRAGLVAIGGLAALLALSLVMTGRLVRPVRRLTDMAGLIASGDLRATLERLPAFEKEAEELTTREYRQLAMAFIEMSRSLHALLGRVREAVVGVTQTSAEIAASARQMESFAAQQAGSTAQVNATAGRIAERSDELARTMNDLAAIAGASAEMAREGRTGLVDMESGIRGLVSSTTTVSARLAAISRQAENIEGITTTIHKVAEQTHLLSINAGIEAEKAGEAGRGFAVVAREIRRLADQTAASTRDIETMIQDMHAAVSSGVMEMDKFMDEVRRAGDEVQRVSGQLATVIEQTRALTPRLEAVCAEMNLQNQGAGQIRDTISALTEAAGQIKQSLQEFNRVTHHLNDAAQGLAAEVARFKMEQEK
ncbi:MAG: methyl-accepting chemotaxis protein [Verrucomicrobia bacterium]|nr:methyl-accepting chemotaxis protein [Verrucomicrobiota bacterium]MBU1908715.1 methyl-accepting chemotaxis protein [Verrucomicrobiota bacterium]